MVVISIHDCTEARRVGKTDQGENRLCTNEKRDLGQTFQKHHYFFVMEEEEQLTKKKKEIDKKKKINRE